MGKRFSVLTNLKTLLEDPSLALTSVSISFRETPIEELDFTEFPLGIIFDSQELDEYFPNQLIKINLLPFFRCFFQNPTYQLIDTFITNVKDLISLNGVSGVDIIYIHQVNTIAPLEHKFVEVSFSLDLSYHHKAGES